MDSALCLRHGALHTPPTTSYAAGLARAYSNFRPSSLSFTPKTSTYRTLSQHTFSRPLICALNNPSPPLPNSYKENCKKVVTVVGGASVVLACILGIINCNCTFNPTAIAGPKPNRPSESTQFPLVLTEPKKALDSLLNMNRPLDHQGYLERFKSQKLDLPRRPSPEDREKLKMGIARLIQSGQWNEAETQLKDLYKKFNQSEPGNDVQMELVRVLILQGKYEEASKCECLKEGTSIESDARVQLYKAIIHTMLMNKDDRKAVECWNKFVSSITTQKSIEEATQSQFFTPRQEDRPLR